MDTFTVHVSRPLFVRLFGGNPLVRASDRVEALVLVLAVVMLVLAAPIAAAVGIAVHSSRSHLYVEQAQNRHMVTATVIGDSDAHRNLFRPTVTAPARWFAAGIEHTGAVTAQRTLKPGDSIDIWVGPDGSRVGPPMSTAVDEAVATALAIWLSVVIAAAALFAASRAALIRKCRTRWQHDVDTLVADGDRCTSQPCRMHRHLPDQPATTLGRFFADARRGAGRRCACSNCFAAQHDSVA